MADELKAEGVRWSGNPREGWLDSTACCQLIARVGGLPEPEGFLTPDQVAARFTHAEWPSVEGLDPGDHLSEYHTIRAAQAFVQICLEQRLAIMFS